MTCTGNRVTVQPLTASGEVIAADLGLDDYRVGEHTYEFPASHAAITGLKVDGLVAAAPRGRYQLPE